MEKQKIAIIDLGTNTFHLLIVAYDERYNYRMIHRERKTVMIGKGGINLGIISDEGQCRALETLEHFQQVIKKNGVEQVAATATSAFRNAKNGQELADRIYQRTGINIDIISGAREAEYIFRGVRSAMPLRGCSVIMDIGGGSVEFIICDADQILWKESFEIGAQRLLDHFDIQDPISEDNIRELLHLFQEKLASLGQAITKYKPTTLIGASGTFDTLSDIYVIHENFSVTPNASELPLTYDFFQQTLSELSKKDRKGRLDMPGMVEMRVDMIVVASWLVQFVLETYHIRNIRVSAFALKEGLLHSVTEDLIANQ